MEEIKVTELDLKTLEYVHALMVEEFDRLTRLHNRMEECGAKNEAEIYLKKRSEVYSLSDKIFSLIKQQEA